MTTKTITIQPSNNKTDAIFQMVQVAAGSKNADPKYLSEMLSVWKDNNAIQAKCDFDAAFAAVKSKLPIIVKNNEVSFNGKSSYQYEDLASISQAIDGILSAHGMSYRFHTSSTADSVTVTCRLSHVSGHTEENSLTGPYDRTGSKNPVQALGSTVSYLQRYTLKAALGLAAAKDNDANYETSPNVFKAPEGAKPCYVNGTQIAELRNLLKKADREEEKLCKLFNVPKIENLTLGRYEEAKDRLNNIINSEVA